MTVKLIKLQQEQNCFMKSYTFLYDTIYNINIERIEEYELVFVIKDKIYIMTTNGVKFLHEALWLSFPYYQTHNIYIPLICCGNP